MSVTLQIKFNSKHLCRPLSETFFHNHLSINYTSLYSMARTSNCFSTSSIFSIDFDNKTGRQTLYNSEVILLLHFLVSSSLKRYIKGNKHNLVFTTPRLRRLLFDLFKTFTFLLHLNDHHRAV